MSPSIIPKRIAIIGWPVLERGVNPLKTGLLNYFDRHEGWEFAFVSEASVEALRLAEKNRCDGMLARIVTPQMAEAARRLPFPVVNISSYLEESGVPTVRRDDRGIARMCVRHLLEKGFTRVGVLRMPYTHYAYRVTEEEVFKVLQGSQVPVTVSAHRLRSIPVQQETALRLRAWLKSIDRPFGLLLLDDITVLDVMECCRLENLSIPKDVAIVTTCGQPSIVRKCQPSLTHAGPDGADLAEASCLYLSDLMQNIDRPQRTITIPVPELVYGESTDTLGAEDPLIARAVNFIHAQLHSGINASDVIEHCECSRRLIEQRFLSLMQTSLHKFIARERVRRACELIRATPEAGLAEISRRVGFGGNRAFRSSFMAETGQSPSDWRKKAAQVPCPGPAEQGLGGGTVKAFDRFSMATRSGGTKRIAIIGWPIFNRSNHPVENALAEYFELRDDWEIVFAGDATVEALDVLGKYRCDGVLARIVTDEMAAAARRLPCPVVNLSSLLENPGVPTVCRDDRAMGQMCVRHLLERGFKRFGVIQAPHTHWHYRQTEAGVMDILQATSETTTFSSHMFHRARADSEPNPGLQAWLKSILPPFGLVVLDDYCAFEVATACRAAGLGIPDDVAVIATCGHGLAARPFRPTVTHVAVAGELLVKAACGYLDELMIAHGLSCERRILPVARIVQGESTDTLAVDDPIVLQALGIIRSQLGLGVSAAEVIAQCKCSRRVLENRFQALMKTTLHDYLLSQRIRHACVLLDSDKHQKLTSISSAAGFGSYKTFRKAFIAATHVSPAEWREARSGLESNVSLRC